MMRYKSKTIDELIKSYEYKINPLNLIDNIHIIYFMFYGQFSITLKEYRFNENIKEIQKIIKNKGNKIDKNRLESFEKTLKEISESCENIRKTIDFDLGENAPILAEISDDYERNINIPGAADIYQKIGKEIIDKEVNKFKGYEKILIYYNGQIINIKKYLSN